MNIRYQNGTAVEAITFSRTEHTMRVAVKGGDDVTEFTNIRGTWVSEDCEPVTFEGGISSGSVDNGSDAYLLCSQELAGHLVRLLLTGSTEDFPTEQSSLRTAAGRSRLIA